MAAAIKPATDNVAPTNIAGRRAVSITTVANLDSRQCPARAQAPGELDLSGQNTFQETISIFRHSQSPALSSMLMDGRRAIIISIQGKFVILVVAHWAAS